VDELSKVMNGNPRARLFAGRGGSGWPSDAAAAGGSPPPARGACSRAARGASMLSVAAELHEMHPQPLRMYEARGLIEPKRSPKGTRLYSQKDVDHLRRIQAMTAELGINLAGVEAVLQIELAVERL